MPIVDAWATATGGRDHLAKHAVQHAKGTFEKLGLEGTSEVWLTARGQLRRENVLHGLHESVVLDGARGWSSNLNGHVIELDGPNLHDVRDEPALLTYGILLQDRKVGRVARASDHALTV